jgi:hypothetical protein
MGPASRPQAIRLTQTITTCTNRVASPAASARLPSGLRQHLRVPTWSSLREETRSVASTDRPARAASSACVDLIALCAATSALAQSSPSQLLGLQWLGSRRSHAGLQAAASRVARVSLIHARVSVCPNLSFPPA